jgi:polysaccharide export outer membrane protein
MSTHCVNRRRLYEPAKLGAALLSILLAACGSNPHPPVPENQRALDANYNYLIGPGDSLEIFVWGNEELSTSALVRPDGKLTTRLVDDLPASGRTATQLSRDIEQAYAKYVRQPVVSVIVNGFSGLPEQQVRVVGEAAEPVSVPFSKHMTLLDLMIAVGGMTDYASGNDSVLVRWEDGTYKSYNLRLDDLLKDGDITANLSLLPGDIIIITESWF